jgi:shikimate dehydrogenase
MIISGTTRVFALLGQPVSHSLSPRMHNAAFLALGLDAVYVALACGADQVGPLMRSLVLAGGGGNVTVPHKAVAAAMVDQTVEPKLEACNTFWGDGDRMVGDNTDVTGILDGLQQLGAPATRWLVLGTGGSSRAAAEAARLAGAAVAIRSRDPARAARLEAEIVERGGQVAEPDACEVVINATPLGLAHGDPLPVEPGACHAVRFALDMVYGQGGTPWVRAMRSAGIRAADGRTVLVAQGAAAFRRWFPGSAAPIEVMRAAVHAALG